MIIYAGWILILMGGNGALTTAHFANKASCESALVQTKAALGSPYGYYFKGICVPWRQGMN